MFERVNAQFSERSMEQQEELKSLILNDPVFSEFITEAGGVAPAFRQLEEYAEGDAALKQRIRDMTTAVYLLEEADMIGLPGITMHNIITRINMANGHQYASSEVNTFFRDPERWAAERAEAAPGNSLTERCYAFLDTKGYHEVQTDKRARMLIQLAHLSEKLLDKVAEIEQQAVIEEHEKKFIQPLNENSQKTFFEELTPEELELIVDDKKMAEKQTELSDSIKKLSAALDICESSGRENVQLRVELLKKAPQDEILKETDRIKAENDAAANIQLEKELNDFRKKLLFKNDNNKDINKEILEENARNQEINDELDKKIADIEKERSEKLRPYDNAEKRAEDFRAERKAQFEEETRTWLSKKKELPEKIEQLEYDIRRLMEFCEASQFVSDIRTAPPEKHFDTIKYYETKIELVDDVRDVMFHSSGRERGALSAVAMLKPDQVKAVSNIREKVAKAEVEMNKALAAVEAGRDRGLPENKLKSLQEKADEAVKRFTEQSRRMEPLKPAAKVQDAFNNLMKDKEISKEYQAFKKNNPGKNVYECLKSMVEAYKSGISEEKSKYGIYYSNMIKYEQAKMRIEKGMHIPLFSMEEFDKHLRKQQTELEEARRELDGLKKPELKTFNEETEKQCAKIFDPKAVAAEKAKINENADASVALLNEQREEISELREVLDEKDLDAAVAQQKEKLAFVIERQFEVKTALEQKKYLNDKAQKLLEAHTQRLHGERRALTYEKEQLLIKKERLNDYFDAQKKSYNEQQSIKNSWDASNEKGYRLDKTLNKNLASIIKGIEKGRVEDHEDTPEYTRMKNALVAASDFVRENGRSISSLNPDTMAELKKKLDTMKQTAETYYEKKQHGIHWRPSDMRFVRLDSAKRISQLVDDTKQTIHNVEKLQFRKEILNSKAKNWAVENPGANAKEYALKSVPTKTSNLLRAKLTREQNAQKHTEKLTDAVNMELKHN